ncbi:MAG TPA: hypothetical protein VGL78_05250 [Solirubrobacteraceae bacterium]
MGETVEVGACELPLERGGDLFVAAAERVLLDDATRLATAAATADVAVQLDVTPGAPHVFQAFAPELGEANAALARTGPFLQAHLQLAE